MHAFLLTPGCSLPLVWVALCGHPVEGAAFEALDPGMGLPCQGCRQRWEARHYQHTDLADRGVVALPRFTEGQTATADCP